MATKPTSGAPVFQFRAGQRALIRRCDEQRMLGFLARRQYGKTTTFSAIALKKMMRRPGRLVTYASATLTLGRELILKESRVMGQAIARLRAQADEAKLKLELADRATGKAAATWSDDDFADIFEAQRLEFRLHHDRTTVSRTIVIAPNPETAVGWTGDVLLDEVGRLKRFRELWEAVEPIASSDPEFRLLLCTTPPPDDAHFSWEMLAPPVGTTLHVNPEGNWYRSEMGVMVLRVDAWDAWADGVPVYDLETGEPLPPDEHRRRSMDKSAWDRNYGVVFVFGGTAAVSLQALDSAQRRGIGQCALIQVDQDTDFDRGLAFLGDKLGRGQVGIGVDLATTEKDSSNPTAITVLERRGADLVAVLTLTWKTRDPALAKERLRRVVQAVATRPLGGRARRMAVDATNERYFAAEVARELAPDIPVECVVGSETIETPGHEPMTMKAWLGALLVAEIDDNHMVLAPERYLKEDFRRVRRDRGSFTCDPGPNGEHGDTFDSHKLALHALSPARGAIDSVRVIRHGQPSFVPARL
jgi:hypothetical protein